MAAGGTYTTFLLYPKNKNSRDISPGKFGGQVIFVHPCQSVFYGNLNLKKISAFIVEMWLCSILLKHHVVRAVF
jgi:hypothetical protein